jgi:hypothetical protein
MPDMYSAENIASSSENRLPICPLHETGAEKSEGTPREENDSLEVISFNPNYYHPMRHHLEKIYWSVWGTITWKNDFRRRGNWDAEKSRRIDFKQLLEKTRTDVGLRGKDIFYYHATEHGKAGEHHFHFLILNKKPLRVSNSLLAQKMQDFWNNDFVLFDSWAKFGGAGIAVVAPYDKDRINSAASYCFKREFDQHGKERERYDDMSGNLIQYLRKKNDSVINQ